MSMTVTGRADADKGVLLAHAQAAGFPEIWVPKAVMVVPAIPVLGSGKCLVGVTQPIDW